MMSWITAWLRPLAEVQGNQREEIRACADSGKSGSKEIYKNVSEQEIQSFRLWVKPSRTGGDFCARIPSFETCCMTNKSRDDESPAYCPPRMPYAAASSRIAVRTFSLTSAGISLMLCSTRACSAHWLRISSSVFPDATKSQSIPTSLQLTLFAMGESLRRESVAQKLSLSD